MVKISLNFDLFNNYYYLYERIIVLLFSLVPTLFLIGFVLYSDRKSKEPFKNIIICLLSGILTTAVASYFESLVMPYFSNNVILTYAWAFIEEISKMAIFFLFIFDNKHYDDIYDGLVYMMLIALSFAGLENLMYAFSESTISDSISLALMRDFTTIPLHVICGVVIGFFASLGNFSKNKVKRYTNFTLAIVFASLIHGTYNNLMSFLGSLKVNYDNFFEVILLQVLPLILIMIILFIIVIKVCKKAISINNIYVQDGQYDAKYNYLMTYDEYENSNYHKKRIDMYNKTNFKEKKEIAFDDTMIEEED